MAEYPMHEKRDEPIKSPIKAIRAYCLDCSNGSPNEVSICPAEDCPLYAFRFGKNPHSNRGKNLTDEQRRILSLRAKENFRHSVLNREQTPEKEE